MVAWWTVERGAVNRSDFAGLAPPLPRFKPYPAYKGSGVECREELPASWGLKRFKRVVACRRGHNDSLFQWRSNVQSPMF